MAMLMRRMKRELELLRNGAAPGVVAWLADESKIDRLEGELTGAEGTPYEGGVFRLDISVPTEYPLKPPAVRFVTKIYHPNIDTEGRICLDTLNMPPKGAWKPALNIPTVLTTVLALMSTPNPDDGLMPEISDLYRRDRVNFERTAREWTQRYAKPGANITCDEAENPPVPSPSATKSSDPTSASLRSRLSRRKTTSSEGSPETKLPKSNASDMAQKRNEKESNDSPKRTPLHKKRSQQQPTSADNSLERKEAEETADHSPKSSPMRHRLSRRKPIEIDFSPESSTVRNKQSRRQPIQIDSSPESTPVRSKVFRRQPILIDSSPESKPTSLPSTNTSAEPLEKRETSVETTPPPQKKKPEKSQPKPSHEVLIFDSDEDDDEDDDANDIKENRVKDNDKGDEEEDDDDLFTEPKSGSIAAPPPAPSTKKSLRLKRRPTTPPIISDDDDEEVVLVRRSRKTARPTRQPRSTTPPPETARSTPRRAGSRLKRRRH